MPDSCDQCGKKQNYDEMIPAGSCYHPMMICRECKDKES